MQPNVAMAPTFKTGRSVFSCWRILVFLGLCAVFVGGFLLPCAAPGAQTRDQCNRCCEQQHQGDQFYIDQCKLKCHRNHDHCVLQKAGVPGETKPGTETKPSTGPTQRRTRTVTLRWPDPLNLTPGREVEAAAQILQANGITTANPNFFQALQSVTALLIQFARENPQGGSLPTTQLKEILLPYM